MAAVGEEAAQTILQISSKAALITFETIVDVNNTPIVTPQTGGIGTTFITVIGGIILATGTAVFAYLDYLISVKRNQ